MEKGYLIEIIAGCSAILVALISIFATCIRDLKKSKRQSDTIINKTNEISSDTAAIKPNVDTIKNDVVKIKDNVVEKIVPELNYSKNAFEGISDKVNKLYDDMTYHNRLQKDLKESVRSKDYFIDGIEVLYQSNALLNADNYSLKKQVRDLSEQLQFRNEKIKALEQENNALKKQIQRTQKNMDLYM